MTQDEIIEMARQAGFSIADGIVTGGTTDIRRFAKLVAAKEREACAKVCDARYMGDNSREDMETKRCAKAIRARGEV
jgi:hypothetical protein